MGTELRGANGRPGQLSICGPSVMRTVSRQPHFREQNSTNCVPKLLLTFQLLPQPRVPGVMELIQGEEEENC